MSKTKKGDKMSNKLIEEIKEDVRKLRDADTHVCQADVNDGEYCSCEEYDRVIDKLDRLKEVNNKYKYCGFDTNSPDEDVLCDECRECFGHTFYSEL